jgi:hypothetical protein
MCKLDYAILQQPAQAHDFGTCTTRPQKEHHNTLEGFWRVCAIARIGKFGISTLTFSLSLSLSSIISL